MDQARVLLSLAPRLASAACRCAPSHREKVTAGVRREGLASPLSGGGQDLRRELLQGGQAERLLQDRHAGLFEESLVVGMPARPGDDDQASQQIGLVALQLPVQSDAIELGHAEIAEDEVILLGGDLLEGKAAVAGGVDLVPFVGQNAG